MRKIPAVMIGAVLVLTGAAPKRMPPVTAAELSVGTTTVEGKAFGGMHAVVRVSVGTTPRPWPHGAAIVWGEFAGPPQRIITAIECRVDTETIDIPLSAFADLGDPRRVILAPQGADSVMRIWGGDTGTLYNAELIFRDRQVVCRRVSLNEFPDEVWEETRYHWIDPHSER